ncbi:MAG: UDP-N-acetylmuramoylalanine--D-glutamate ligase [Motiliproteus sp.]|jgi:UDP-N-acetylmuramoylalanine--D-glutamate ligase
MQLIGSDTFSIIIGLGKTGLSCARFLAAQGKAFAVADTRELPPNVALFKQHYSTVELRCGPLDSDWLRGADRLLVSPGVSRNDPAIKEAERAGVEILGDIDLFCQAVDAPIIAITGSNAKSTVTTLVGQMATDAGIKAGVGGNLGTPVLDLLQEGEKALYVLELSSFQLETTRWLQAAAATVLNITPDHMDRYPNLGAYHSAKQRVYRHCLHAVYNADDLLTQPLLSDAIPQVSFRLGTPNLQQFGLLQHDGELYLAKGLIPLMPVSRMLLKGSHNQANALAALALGDAVGLPIESMLQTLQHFGGLEHRCQWVRELDGVAYYNDSKGTNVGATLAAISGLGAELSGKLILIAGGEGKGADFSALAEPMRRWGALALLIGRDAQTLATALEGHCLCQTQTSLESAVRAAQQRAEPGDLVLLSPACASFDMFTGFEHRGRCFIDEVEALLPAFERGAG